ncbi:LysE family translocator [Halorarius halobius]|uniref:LysE family translocator n=1 Tax=Halorarius halobius TaxID=2962671 RepID=UPI0020CDD25E|nr:LysE family translocator [Halorarius halobius]
MVEATLLAYVVAAVALILTPGPDTAFVLAQSVGGGRTAGVRAALGVAAGVLVHTVAATVGLAALLRASAVAYDAVALVGAAYLVYLGVDILRSGEFEMDGAAPSGGFRRGLVTNVLNPKVALFFLAFLPQFGTGLELLPLGGLYAAITAVYLGGLAALSGRARAAIERPGVRRWLRRVAGGTTIALGALAAREAL